MGKAHQGPVRYSGHVMVTPQDASDNAASFSSQMPSDSPSTAYQYQNTMGGTLDADLQRIQDQAEALIASMQGDPNSMFPQLDGNTSVHITDLQNGVPSSYQPMGGDGQIVLAQPIIEEAHTWVDPISQVFNQAGQIITEHANSFTGQMQEAMDQVTFGIPQTLGSAFSDAGSNIETEWDTIQQKVQNVAGDLNPLNGWKSDIKELAIVGAVLFGLVWVSTGKQRSAVYQYGKELGKRSFNEFTQAAPKLAPLLLL